MRNLRWELTDLLLDGRALCFYAKELGKGQLDFFS
jgi:hypothetical protein